MRFQLKSSSRVFVALLAWCVLAVSTAARAEWPRDPSINVPVCTAPGSQGFDGFPFTSIVTDGEGGSIIAWLDYATWGIYAQRLDAEGNTRWKKNGVLVPGSSSVAVGSGYYHGDFRMIADGKGGAVFAWQDLRNGNFDIYAQRLSPTGAALWNSTSVPVARVGGSQTWPELVGDGSGGAYIAWRDQRTAPSDSYVQWIGANGNPKWQVNGVNVSGARNHQYYPHIITDGQGGVIVTWMDDRSHSSFYHWQIYAQRFNASGQPQWATDGVRVSGSNGYGFMNPRIVSDGTGGAIILFRRQAYDPACPSCVSAREFHAQRINASGNKLWGPDGVQITPTNGQIWQTSGYWHGSFLEDKAGGAYYVWSEGNNVRVQHVNSAGSPQWGSNGLPVLDNNNGLREDPRAAEDGEGGVLIAWEEWIWNSSDIYIYTQRVSPDGSRKWHGGGVPVSTAGESRGPQLTGDSDGGSILTWTDSRGNGTDIYAQRVFHNGQLGLVFPLGAIKLLLME